ncbi:MOSC domain-containing protein [Streptantibioticus rubrisoli]|uniref:MOSC domain-containing protein n=1 Tax=Streptantibioticus rubrisoli TaxID=1387313 RepID=A0ABT1PJN8_9ACTN|nr:MOSC domain-containing protein [Streptantibioticus rubrisoli]MCQ4044718.1 MOSC domain-containing protein [Streptantibioticus rubrisoli]
MDVTGDGAVDFVNIYADPDSTLAMNIFCLGVYLDVLEPGTVRIGDSVTLRAIRDT